MFDAILLMAGDSNRSKLGYNKVFYEINKIPLYQYSLDKFLSIKECRKVVLVVKDEDKHKLTNLSNRVVITTGGKTRQESVANGVKLATSDYILIHDAARCNIKANDILKVYEGVKQYQACTIAFKPNDTIKVVSDGLVIKTLNRNELWSVQTPQGIKRELYEACLDKAIKDSYTGFDDVELVEKYGKINVRIIEGEKTNIKVTTPEDFKLMEFYLKEGL